MVLRWDSYLLKGSEHGITVVEYKSMGKESTIQEKEEYK